MPELTEKQVRAIAREESLATQRDLLKELSEVRDTLKRLERLLLGEMGVDTEDTLKSRAIYAFQFAKKCTESKIVEKTEPVLEWFHDWDVVEKGETESKLETLGKIIGLYGNLKWILGLLGITTLVNAVPIITSLLQWLQSLGH